MEFSKKEAVRVEQEPVTAGSDQRATVVKKRSAWSTVAFLFLLLLLIALGASAWLWTMWQDSQNQVSANKSDLTAATATIANLREQLGKANGQAEAEAALPVNDEETIKTAVKNFNASLAAPVKDAKVEVTKKDGDQAIATVADTTAGYKVYLKKTDQSWTAVWSGQNTPPADVISRFGLKL